MHDFARTLRGRAAGGRGGAVPSAPAPDADLDALIAARGARTGLSLAIHILRREIAAADLITFAAVLATGLTVAAMLAMIGGAA